MVPPRNPRQKLSYNLESANQDDDQAFPSRGLEQLLNLYEGEDPPGPSTLVDRQASQRSKGSSARSHCASNQKQSDEIPITRLDHVIASHGGTKTSIERLPGHVRRSKNMSHSLEKELLEQKTENSRLRAELTYHEKVRHVLMGLYAKTVES
ncbi:hypothetical protein AJ80_01091 [Polytolypa hystricis UAMH7299]|uniref:Uncharacterized protein n=1 Tax=Polytolypa hystricis (strain UAMH7299) TaxID=1447883 RepID=A0A2B7Z0L2_POLH7|nr:hypothetical protein AJ80_01091 [Polytolypa hystricis UAMH7299]